MAFLPTQDLQELEAELKRQRKVLLGALHARLHHADAEDEMALINYFATIGDRADAASMSENDIAQLKHELDELRQVDAALARMADGGYGQCAACEEAIGLARMRAQPSATLCLACQQRAEQYSASGFKPGGAGPRPS